MQRAKETVSKFLSKYGMDFESVDLQKNCEVFMEEMKNGLEGKKSSLKMIPTYISLDREIPVEEPVIVVDAGGTNFRVAVVHFDKAKKPVIEDFKLHPMPGTKGEISREEFFNTVARYMEPVLNKSNKIGFCFSYPTEILPNKDGRLIQFCKEVQVKGVDGQLIGGNLFQTFKQMGYAEEKSIVLLNDTVATLLGGKATYPDRIFDSYIGFILGTGTNTCYIEEYGNIKKLPDLASSEGSMLVNIESGAYGKAPRGAIDLEFDNGLVNPGEYSFEKMISGGYQGGLMLAVIRKAAEEGLFTGYFKEKVKGVAELTSKEIDDFLYYPYGGNTLAGCCADAMGDQTDDRQVLYFLIDGMIERAARLVAVNMSAVIVKTGRGANPCSPVCITAEGTTFYKSKLFKNKLEYYIRTYLNEHKGFYCEFVKAENATLIGTAIAGLLG